MAHWRHSFRYPRFFFLDARVAIIVVVFLLHIRLWTLILMCAIFVAFYWVERFGYDFPSALRALRVQLTSKVRDPLPDDKTRHPVDFERRPLF